MDLSSGQSDIAALWEQALDQYSEISSVDLRIMLSSDRNTSVASIIYQQHQQLETFKSFRHDNSRLDKLRSMVSANASLIQSAANQLAGAASAAFPPSSAILTAFTHVLTASKHVSDDYNIIEGFFDLMQSFLRRLSLLEGKIPPRREFQMDLIKVFSSILKLSAIAYSYRVKKRFKLWASALVSGKDPKLQGAYDTLHEDLRRLESATMMQTLRTVIDTRDDMKQIGHEIKEIRQSVNALHITATDTNTNVTELVKRSRETAHMHQQILRALQPHAQQAKMKDQMRSRVGRPANFERLKQLLFNYNDGAMRRRMRELEDASVDRLFGWIEEEAALQDIVSNTERFLWVSGGPGMGKSTVAYKIFQSLRTRFSSDASVSVACYFFDEQNFYIPLFMLRWCSLMVAEQDARYCETTLRDVRLTHLTSDDEKRSSIEENWRCLFETKYPSGSDRRLILVLDGIQSLDAKASYGGSAKVIELLRAIERHKCEIQVILTGDEALSEILPSSVTPRVDLDRERVAVDLRRFASSMVKSLPRLRKLKPKVRQSIIKNVSAKADSFLYVSHAMRRLDGLGYDGPIRREMAKLPAGTSKLYDILLKDCLENTSSANREVLRGLLAWTAYSRSNLTLAEANLLVAVIKKEHLVSMDEVIEGPLGRLLRVARRGDVEIDRDPENEVSDASSGAKSDHRGEESAGDSEGMSRATEDAETLLDFQEPSMRAYFRRVMADESNPHGLLCSPAEAECLIFKLLCVILTLEKGYGASVLSYLSDKYGSTAQTSLVGYARNGVLWHFVQIDSSKVSDELANGVLEGLHSLLTNQQRCLKTLEESVRNGVSTIFSEGWVDEDQVLEALGIWARRALNMPAGSLADKVRELYRPLAEEPKAVFIPVARSHIENWFSAVDQSSAMGSFLAAHSALLGGKSVPELQGNPELHTYLNKTLDEEPVPLSRAIEIISNAFPDIEKTAAAYEGIALAMRHCDLNTEAISMIDKGLSLENIPGPEHLWLLQSKGGAFFDLALGAEDDQNEKKNYAKMCLETLSKAREVYSSLQKINSDAITTEESNETTSFIFGIRARAAVILGEFDMAVEHVKRGSGLSTGGVEHVVETMQQVIPVLVREGEYNKVMDVLRSVSKAELTAYIGELNIDIDSPHHEAAKKSGQERGLLDLYATVINILSEDQAVSVRFLKVYTQGAAAGFAQRVMEDAEEAKRLWQDIIRDPYATHHQIQLACYHLTEVYLEDFRLSGDPKTQRTALEATKALQAKRTQVLGDSKDQEFGESAISVPLALMLRKLGPAFEMVEVLQTSFTACMDMLRDDTGNNDSVALRLLARVLCCAEGLEKEAQIVLSAQLYVLDREIREKDLSQSQQGLATEEEETTDEPEEEATKEAVGASETAPVQDTTAGAASRTDTIRKPTAATNTPQDILPEPEYLDLAYFYCDTCGKRFNNYDNGGAYMCIYCIDVDICEDCWAKRDAREKGELEPDWRVSCPTGHKHIKVPAEGWGGVRDGNLIIGDDTLPLKEWLGDVEIKWKAYWEKFWLEKDM